MRHLNTANGNYIKSETNEKNCADSSDNGHLLNLPTNILSKIDEKDILKEREREREREREKFLQTLFLISVMNNGIVISIIRLSYKEEIH